MTTPARASDIVFTRYGARRGLAWLAEAYRMFARARLPWLAVLALYWFIIVVASVVPVAGHLLYILLKPVFAVGLLAAAWTQERGGRPGPAQLFQGFRANLMALLSLGALFVAGVTAAVMATTLFDGGLLFDLLSREPRSGDMAAEAASIEELLKAGKLQSSLIVAACLTIPTILALWFAPALVVFQDAGPLTALGASLRATLANWRPLLVYTLAVVAFAILPLILSQLAVRILPSELTLVVVRIALLAYGLGFAATLHISDYVSYRDVFHAGETLAPLAPAERQAPR
jgi:hypothetical protein